MSKLRDRRTRHDPFYKRAKGEQYAARSVYKLEEIDRRHRLLRRGQRVLDLGCRPGSWLQLVVERIGPRGRAVGIDREPLAITLPENVRIEVGDVFEVDAAQLRGDLPCFHLVLSDMAPDTTGVSFTDQVRSVELFGRALEIATSVGCPGSAFVAKVFMGDGFKDAIAAARERYDECKTVRPEATRKSSKEVYVVAQGLETRPKRADTPDHPQEGQPAPAADATAAGKAGSGDE